MISRKKLKIYWAIIKLIYKKSNFMKNPMGVHRASTG